MKIKNKFKFIRSSILIIFILSIFFCKATLSYKIKNIEYTEIHVESGDTLWTIAENLKENNLYYKNKDIREIVYEIKSMNNLSNSSIYINQVLLIGSNCNK